MRARPPLLLLLLLLVTAASATAESGDGPFQFAVAKMLAAEGNIRGALDAFEKAVEAEPADVYLRVEYAEFLYRIRRLEEAAEQAALALELGPDSIDAMRMFGQIQLTRAGDDRRAMVEALGVFERLREKIPEDVPAMLALGQIYAHLDRLGDAAEVYEELVSHHPDNRRLKRLLVDTLARSGQEERAEEVLREILRLDSEALESRLRLAGLESDRGNHAAAVEILRSAGAEIQGDLRLRSMLAHELFRYATSPGLEEERREQGLQEALEIVDGALEEDHELGSMLFLRARILTEQGRAESALEVLRELRRRAPDDLAVALQLAQALEQEGEVAEAAELLEGLGLELTEEEGSTEIRLRLAGLHARHGDWRGVAEVTGQLLESESSPVAEEGGLRRQVLALHLDSLSRLERYDAALAQLRREEKRTGITPHLLLERVEILIAAERPKAALDLLARRELEETTEPEIVVERARLYLGLDKPEEAARLLAGMTADDDAERLLQAGQVYLFEERFAEAIPYLERALAGPDLPPPAVVDLHYWLGMAHERTASYDRAATHFETVLELEPNHGGALNYLGYMWAERGTNLDRALELVQRAVALEPDNGAYIDSLGWAHFQLGQLEEAQSHLERAAELIPDDPTILEHLGDLYVALGRLGEAREAYEKALKINSEENVEQVRRKLDEL